MTWFFGKLLQDRARLLKYCPNEVNEGVASCSCCWPCLFKNKKKFMFVPLENIHEHLDLALNSSHKLNIFWCMYVTKIYKNLLVTNAYGLHV